MPSSARVWLLGCAIWLTACGGRPEPTPTPETVRVGVTADLVGSVLEPIREYQAAEPTAHIKLVTLAPSGTEEALLDGDIDLLIGIQPPETADFATSLIPEGIAIILNPSVDVRDFQLEELVEVFSGKAMDWEELGGAAEEIQPVILQTGSEARDALSAILPELQYSTASLIAPHPAAMMEIVEAERGAIGFLPAGSLGEGVGIGAVDGTRPSPSNIRSGDYPLTIQIQAFALEEPTGAARDFLIWWQSQ